MAARDANVTELGQHIQCPNVGASNVFFMAFKATSDNC